MQKRAKTPTRNYTVRLQKGGALLDYVRSLVRIWDSESSTAENARRVIHHDVLSGASRSRVDDILKRVFFPRFVNGDPSDAWHLVRPLEDASIEQRILIPVYYWITARSDPVIYDFVVGELLERSISNRHIVGVEDTCEWLNSKLQSSGRNWKASSVLKVAQGLLAALRDFGILEGRSKKKIAPVYLSIEAFSYLAFVLNAIGFSGQALLEHPDWKLFLLDRGTVEMLFMRAQQHKFLKIDAAGNIYRIEFPVDSMEGMANVISR